MQDASARIPCRAYHWTSVLQRQLECVVNINISININSNNNFIKPTAPAPSSTTSAGIFWSSPIFCGPVWTGSTFETFDPSPHLNTILNVCDIVTLPYINQIWGLKVRLWIRSLMKWEHFTKVRVVRSLCFCEENRCFSIFSRLHFGKLICLWNGSVLKLVDDKEVQKGFFRVETIGRNCKAYFSTQSNETIDQKYLRSWKSSTNFISALAY